MINVWYNKKFSLREIVTITLIINTLATQHWVCRGEFSWVDSRRPYMDGNICSRQIPEVKQLIVMGDSSRARTLSVLVSMWSGELCSGSFMFRATKIPMMMPWGSTFLTTVITQKRLNK